MVWLLEDVKSIFENDTVLVKAYQVYSTTAWTYTLYYDFHRETKAKRHLKQTFMFSLIKKCHYRYKHAVHNVDLSTASFHEMRNEDLISIRTYEFLSHKEDIIAYIDNTKYMKKQNFKHVPETISAILKMKERIDGSKGDGEFTSEIIICRTGYI